MEKGVEKMEELDYRDEGCEMSFRNGCFTHEHVRAVVALTGPAKTGSINIQSWMCERHPNMTLPLPRELLTVDGCCRRSCIFFSGIATGQLPMLQWITPHPCPHGNTWLNSVSHAIKQKQYKKT